MNRIQKEIEDQKTRFGKMSDTEEEIKEIVSLLDFSLGEWRRFQEMKSLAVATGILTPEEGDTISQFFGDSVKDFNNQPPEVKVAMSQVYHELYV